MVGSAASKYFEGILFIFFRRKYCASEGGLVESENLLSLTISALND